MRLERRRAVQRLCHQTELQHRILQQFSEFVFPILNREKPVHHRFLQLVKVEALGNSANRILVDPNIHDRNPGTTGEEKTVLAGNL